jgi:uncharacterized protein YjbI with pentapeptide repeats
MSMKLERTKQRVEATDVDMSGSTFNDVNLAGAAFNDVNLAGTTIHDANLSRVRISKADLRGASIVDSQTDGMIIEGIAVADLLAAYRAGHSG